MTAPLVFVRKAELRSRPAAIAAKCNLRQKASVGAGSGAVPRGALSANRRAASVHVGPPLDRRRIPDSDWTRGLSAERSLMSFRETTTD